MDISNDFKKFIEPFNLFGIRAAIHSKEEAAKVLRANSYYILFVAAITLAAYILVLAYSIDVTPMRAILLILSAYYFALGFAIRFLKSRIASVLSLTMFVLNTSFSIINSDARGWFLPSLIFVAASYRAVKASFYYHKK